MNKFFLFQRIIKDRPVAYHPDFAKAIGSVQAALFLSQLLYWSDKGNNDGWIYKTQKEFYEETGLSRREQETARKRLKELGILEEKYQGIPRRLYYRVNMNRLAGLMLDYYNANNNAQIRHYGTADSDRQEYTIPPSKSGEIRQPNTEITTENTTEITERDINRELPREEKSEPPKEVNLEKREQAGGGKPFDAVKESQPATSVNRLPKRLYISPHAKQIINAFKDQFLTKFGIPPTITTKAVQELESILSRLSDTEKFAFVQRAAGAIERYLKSEEPFLKKAGYSFQVFVSTMQKYMLEEKKEERREPEPQDGIIEEIEL